MGASENSNARDIAQHGDRSVSGSPEADEIYAVVSVLYHALEGASAYDKYIGDAQKAGDAELERFFVSCRTEEHARVRRARSLLVERLAGDEDEFGPASAASDEVEAIADGR